MPPRRAPHSPALRRAQLSAEIQRKTPRPERANPPAAVRVPRTIGAEKEPPVRANPLTQFAHPGFPVQKRSRPLGANPPAAVRAPRWVGAENPGNPEKIFLPEKAAKTPILTLRKRLSERYS